MSKPSIPLIPDFVRWYKLASSSSLTVTTSTGYPGYPDAASSKTKVYVCSGESSTTATESIPWATDSVSQLPTSFMPAQVTGIAGQGDNTNAYFTGGPSYSHTQRIVYSSDTVSVLPGANFPAGNVNAYYYGNPLLGPNNL